jgi:hypothetical protein
VRDLGLEVEDAMSTTWASKISWISVADEVVDRLRVELARDRRLDAVDQRQLGVSAAVSRARAARCRARR